jgi:hypothetical protein
MLCKPAPLIAPPTENLNHDRRNSSTRHGCHHATRIAGVDCTLFHPPCPRSNAFLSPSSPETIECPSSPSPSQSVCLTPCPPDRPLPSSVNKIEGLSCLFRTPGPRSTAFHSHSSPSHFTLFPSARRRPPLDSTRGDWAAADEGPGIPADSLKRQSDPWFSPPRSDAARTRAVH